MLDARMCILTMQGEKNRAERCPKPSLGVLSCDALHRETCEKKVSINASYNSSTFD